MSSKPHATMKVNGDLVAVVEFAHGPRNTFTPELIWKITHAVEAASGAGARSVVLSGRGRHFCAGIDLADASLDSLAAVVAEDAHVYEAALRLLDQPLPIIAAVQGAALGGGLGLAMICDRRIATPDSAFEATFAKIAIHHGFGLSATLPRWVGHAHALDLLLTARRVRGDEALAIGLVDQVVAADDLLPAALAYAASIASMAPAVVQDMRRTLLCDLADHVRVATERERAAQARHRNHPNFQEGLSAALERRRPKFSDLREVDSGEVSRATLPKELFQ
jgi:2-(1,2-epoxy-1,2-dihydrophenyl)acetyl-CoA isomerase